MACGAKYCHHWFGRTHLIHFHLLHSEMLKAYTKSCQPDVQSWQDLSCGCSGNADLIGLMHLISRVVGVAARIKGVKGAPVIVIEGKAELDPLGQVRIRNEVAT